MPDIKQIYATQLSVHFISVCKKIYEEVSIWNNKKNYMKNQFIYTCFGQQFIAPIF